jgi:hypothetical protein
VATKRQRRRREKERRHEYEYVYVDPEGQEVEVDEPEPKPRAERKQAAAKAKPGAKTTPRGERVVEPPSWDRTFRRAAIFVPIMLVVLYIAKPKGMSTLAVAVQAAFLAVVLILFMYAMDSFIYRSYQKRLAKRSGSTPKPK